MTREKRGKELAAELREQLRTRPAAEWCSACGEWTSWTHNHEQAESSSDDQPQGGDQ